MFFLLLVASPLLIGERHGPNPGDKYKNITIVDAILKGIFQWDNILHGDITLLEKSWIAFKWKNQFKWHLKDDYMLIK